MFLSLLTFKLIFCVLSFDFLNLGFCAVLFNKSFFSEQLIRFSNSLPNQHYLQL